MGYWSSWLCFVWGVGYGSSLVWVCSVGACVGRWGRVWACALPIDVECKGLGGDMEGWWVVGCWVSTVGWDGVASLEVYVVGSGCV